jgi:uncharacterized protein (TIGR04255 family)
VLGQVKISPILKMPDFVPEIQEGLRSRGFPGYGLRTIQEISFGPVVQASQSERWLFANRQKTRSVILARDFVVIATSAYDGFDEFVETLKGVLEIVGAATSPGYSDRLGLRYVDLIRTGPDESLADYLQPGVRGLRPADLGASSALQQMQIQASTSVGTLTVRLWQNTDGRILPPDISGDEVVPRLVAPPAGELLTILDIDHFSEREREFEPSALISEMWALHDGTDRAFRSVVTEEAMSRWGSSTAASHEKST